MSMMDGEPCPYEFEKFGLISISLEGEGSWRSNLVQFWALSLFPDFAFWFLCLVSMNLPNFSLLPLPSHPVHQLVAALPELLPLPGQFLGPPAFALHRLGPAHQLGIGLSLGLQLLLQTTNFFQMGLKWAKMGFTKKEIFSQGSGILDECPKSRTEKMKEEVEC